jgi:murein DD-endopeptidase MepM/ murein hydrolase activator NlpD
MIQRTITLFVLGIIIFNLSFEGEAFLLKQNKEIIEAIDVPRELEQPLRHSSVLATLTDSEDDFIELAHIQGNSLISSSAPSAVPGKEIIYYEVQLGDTPSSIAARFGVSVNTILWANNLKSSDYIRPGDQLEILPLTGVKHKVKFGETINGIALKYGAKPEKIIDFNELSPEGGLQAGQILIIPDGKIKKKKRSRSYYVKKLPELKGYFTYPTTGVITQGLHPYNAIDIANRCGTPVYAAAKGKVIVAKSKGWNGGAGKYIKIKHPNGTRTLYAHLSKLLVGVGQAVKKGQKIGLIGNTGRVRGPTGCHLHFEVHGAKNPLAR